MKATFKAQQFQQTITQMTPDGKAQPYTRTSITISYVSACGHILVATDVCEERPKEWDARVYVPADEFGIIEKTFRSRKEAVEWGMAEMPMHVAKWETRYGNPIDLPEIEQHESEVDHD